MDLRSVARVLNGHLVGRNRIVAPGPGHSDRDRSMSVLFIGGDPGDYVVTSFAGDDWRRCRDHVDAALGDVPRQLRLRDRAPVNTAIPVLTDTSTMALRLWTEARPIAGTPAEIYLLHRGLVPPSEALDGHALQFHPSCPFKGLDGSRLAFPSLVAAMTDVSSGEFRGIHRTALSKDGLGKSVDRRLGPAKRMLGPAANACIRLSPDDEVTTGLHIAEGLETAIACRNMGFSPIWVALSAGGVRSFPVLPGVECLTIFADNDAAGLGAAEECRARWVNAGAEVRLAIPARPGADFADARAK